MQDMIPFALKALDMFFHYQQLRPGQDQVVNAILNNRDVLAVMPTGAGKSICYQLPATRPNSLTLVITPLRALMRDQVQALQARNIPAALIDSGITTEDRDRIYHDAHEGRLRLLYVAPERLFTGDFQDLVQTTPIQLIAVDEAHCVLQWGHDFRSSYLHIGDFIQHLPARPVVAAFTATATPQQIPQICRNLGLHDPIQVRTGFDRPNIKFTVLQMKPTARMKFIANYARNHSTPGIIYSNSRRECDMIAELLKNDGVKAEPFYATLTDDQKAAIQDRFLDNRLQIICATTAFGMGVDKPDIRWVINNGACDSLEGFYQEAGRAGRDRQPAESILLWTPGDFSQMRHRIRATAGSTVTDPQEKQQAVNAAYDRLSGMDAYCQAPVNGICLRKTLLEYFGDHQTTPSCDNCSVCCDETPIGEPSQGKKVTRGDGSGSSRNPFDTPFFNENPLVSTPSAAKTAAKPSREPLPTQPATDTDRQRMQTITTFIQQAVAKIGHGYGMSKTISALRGEPKAAELNVSDITGYGQLKGVKYADIRRLVETLIQNGNLAYGRFGTVIPADPDKPIPDRTITMEAMEQKTAEAKAKRDARKQAAAA